MAKVQFVPEGVGYDVVVYFREGDTFSDVSAVMDGGRVNRLLLDCRSNGVYRVVARSSEMEYDCAVLPGMRAVHIIGTPITPF